MPWAAISAPLNLVSGAVMALREYPRIDKLILVGDTPQIEAELKKHGCNDGRVEIVHSTQVVEMQDKPVESVRRKKDSSISRAVDLVKKGDADAVVSAGHTGAAVAATTIKLRTLPGIERPGIASVIPTESNLFVLIDAGANVDAKPMHLLQYGIMGSVYSRHVLGFQQPVRRLDVDRRGRRERHRIHAGSVQDAEGERAEFPRQHRGARPFRASGRGRRL